MPNKRKTSRKRPALQRVPLPSVLTAIRGTVYVTMSIGQWDAFLRVSYEMGAVLLELDDEERPITAFRQRGSIRPEERN